MTHESSQERSIGRFAGAAGIRAKPMRAMQMRCPTKVQTVRSAALNQCRYSIKERRPHNRPRGFPLRSVLLPMSVAGFFTVQQDGPAA